MALSIVIPMSGAGSRFIKENYVDPKPFILIDSIPMIYHVVENIGIIGARYIFIVQKEHMKKYGAAFIEGLKERVKDFEIVELDGVTEGAACSILKAKEYINNQDGLLIVNSDQLVGDGDIKRFVSWSEKNKQDGSIMCFFNKGIKWSYVEINDQREITRVAEKQPISEHASVGIYLFNEGADFVECAEEMISKNDRVNGEFYLAPVYNYMIRKDQKILPYFVNEFHGLGTPEDLEKFLIK